jgi:hypothetical protein
MTSGLGLLICPAIALVDASMLAAICNAITKYRQNFMVIHSRSIGQSGPKPNLSITV